MTVNVEIGIKILLGSPENLGDLGLCIE